MYAGRGDHLRGQRTPQYGMMGLPQCRRQQYPDELYVGIIGWPCHLGGSVAVTQAIADGSLKNCLVFYGPTISEVTEWQQQARFTLLTRCIYHCEAQSGHDRADVYPIDLTALAMCIHTVYPDGLGQGRTGNVALRGIGIVPTYGMAPGADDNEGIAAPAGMLIIQRATIGAGVPGLMPVSIRYVIMLSPKNI